MGQDDPSRDMVIIVIPRSMQAEVEALIALTTQTPTYRDAEGLAADEAEIYRQCDALGTRILQERLQSTLQTEAIRDAARELAKCDGRRVKDQGKRQVPVMTSRGGIITVTTSYFSRNCDRDRCRRGSFPALSLLGVLGRRRYYTAGLSRHVVLLTTALGSIEEAKDWLKATGISLSVQTIQRMSYQFAQRVRQRQQLGELTLQERAEGRRVVVSIDGGRIRIRSNKRGRKSRKGRRHYDTHWREPKLLIIYVVNAEGRLDREWSPIMDGLLQTRGDAADDLFELLKCYLQLIGIQEADKVLLVADGARWIWKRFGKLVQSLGLDTKRVMELIDFYHAVEQLGKIAQLKRSWNATRRKAWVSKQKTRLKKGQIDQMLHAITAICRGRLSKELRTARDYFFNNRERLDYRKMARLKLPRGSGAIESAVRRVVNLRLKGAGIFWLEDSANAMLLLRSYYKAGRIDDLMTMAFATPLKTAA